MPMKEQYYTVGGQMIGYKDASGRKDYLTDNLGSVLSEVDQTGNNQTFIGRYKPYGGIQSATGTPGKFGWIGTWGYRGTGLIASSHYVRARHYSKTSGNWTTIDPLWPDEAAYRYGNEIPTLRIDPSGLSCADYAKIWTPPSSSDKPLSKQAKFRKCQDSLEWANKQVGFAGLNLPCPGGKKEICEACSKASGLPIICDGMPTCDASGIDTHAIVGFVAQPITPWPFGGGMGEGSFFDYDGCHQACEALCSSDKYYLGKKLCKKACVDNCAKFARGGCNGLEKYCNKLCSGGHKYMCEHCLALWDEAGCPAMVVTPP